MMVVDIYFFQLFYVVLAVCVHILSHIALSRLGQSHFKAVFLGFIIGLLSVIGLTYFSQEAQEFYFLNSLCFSAIGYCYFHYTNIGETSVRIRILRELDRNSLSLEELYHLYDGKKILKARIQRLLEGEHIYKSKLHYFPETKSWILCVARIFQMLKWCVFGCSSGKSQKLEGTN